MLLLQFILGWTLFKGFSTGLKGDGSTFFTLENTPNLVSKLIVLLLAVTNVTFVRTFWLQIVGLSIQ